MEKKQTMSAVGMAAILCVAGCAAIAAVPLLGIGAAGGLAALISGQWALGLVAVAGVGGWLAVRFFRSRKRVAVEDIPATGCGCAPNSGCNTGDACDIPQTGSRTTLRDRLKSIC